jgi:uncharacterized protein (DUF2141 family)
LASCAQVVAPGGGKKDRTPPKVVNYIPDSASLNFKAKSIAVIFDEYIQLKDLNNQLIISPPLNKIPDIKIKDKTLLINLDESGILKPNTTYCFSFGNALQDINENNPKENFKYIFSTGSFIDSLTVNGKVENAFDHKTEKGILVMLYDDFSDSVIYKKQPEYFAKTKEDGTFQINNIRDGKYKILALKDANANYKYDAETESIGFIDSLIDVSKKQNILIELFQEPQKKLFLKKHFQNSYGKIVFIFNKTADSVKIKPINYTFNENEVILDYSTNKDTLTYWIKNFDKDSLILQLSNGSKILDTIAFKMIKKEDALKSNRNPLRLSLLSSPNGNQNFDLNSELNFVFNNPIAEWEEQPIQFKEDTLNWRKKSNGLSYYIGLSYFINFQTISLCSVDSTTMEENPGIMIPTRIKIRLHIWKENTKYHLFIPPGTFTDIFGLKNDTIKIDFKTREEKFYGTVKLKVNIPIGKDSTKRNYIVQLLDEKENLIRENNINKTETIDYNYLYPQKYKLKIIIDDNGNGKWDTGNLLQKRQPEKVIYYSEPINIRSNWDSDLEWRVSE